MAVLVSLKPDALLRRTESLPVLARRDEGFDHVGVLEVAAELVQLRQPEVIARIVSVWRVVRVSPQIAEELHQHKRSIEFSAIQVRMLRDLSQDLSARFRPGRMLRTQRSQLRCR